MTETILIVDDEESGPPDLPRVARARPAWASSVLAAAGRRVGPRRRQRAPDRPRRPRLEPRLRVATGCGCSKTSSSSTPTSSPSWSPGSPHQATPLDALRMGVRDYLDKNQDLNRETFLARRPQATRPHPPGQAAARSSTDGLAAFREAVEKILPLVQSAAGVQRPGAAAGGRARPVPVPDPRPPGRPTACSSVRHARRRRHRAVRRRSAPDGQAAPGARRAVRPVAGRRACVSMQEPMRHDGADPGSLGAVRAAAVRGGPARASWPPRSRSAPGRQSCWSCSTSPAGFTAGDRQLVAAAADFGADLLRQALAERQTHRVLFDAVEAALQASEQVTGRAAGRPRRRRRAPLAGRVMERLRAGLARRRERGRGRRTSLRLAEAVRELAVRHGPPAVEHCIAAGARTCGSCWTRPRRHPADGREPRSCRLVTGARRRCSTRSSRLLTPDRLLRDPRATGEGVAVAVIDTGVERSVLEDKFRRPAADPPDRRGDLPRRSAPRRCRTPATSRARTAPPSPTSS